MQLRKEKLINQIDCFYFCIIKNYEIKIGTKFAYLWKTNQIL